MPAVPSPPAASRSTITTLAPRPAKPRAVARPIPLAPPVINATLFWKFIASPSLLWIPGSPCGRRAAGGNGGARRDLRLERNQRSTGGAKCLDGFERKPRGFRHPRQREEDSAQADDGEHREGEGETRAGEHQREGEDH